MTAAPIISLAERRAQRSKDAFLEAVQSIYGVVPSDACDSLGKLLQRLAGQVGHIAAVTRRADQRSHAALVYVYARRCWETMGLGSIAAFDRGVAEQGPQETPPRADLTWWLVVVVDAMGEVGNLYTAWWGASVDDYADNLADHLVLMGAKMRTWWETTQGE